MRVKYHDSLAVLCTLKIFARKKLVLPPIIYFDFQLFSFDVA